LRSRLGRGDGRGLCLRLQVFEDAGHSRVADAEGSRDRAGRRAVGQLGEDLGQLVAFDARHAGGAQLGEQRPGQVVERLAGEG
jgi:hypothetical protein